MKKLFLKIFLNLFVYYLFDYIFFNNLNNFWLNLNLFKNFLILQYYSKIAFIFLIFNIFYNFFFISLFNLIYNFYNIIFRIFETGYINSYQIYYLNNSTLKIIILNNNINIKKDVFFI